MGWVAVTADAVLLKDRESKLRTDPLARSRIGGCDVRRDGSGGRRSYRCRKRAHPYPQPKGAVPHAPVHVFPPASLSCFPYG